MKLTKRAESLSDYEKIKEPNFTEETVMKTIGADGMQNLIDALEELEFSPYNDSFRVKKDIQKLNTKYSVQFSRVSVEFEKWASQRRQTIKLMDKLMEDIKCIRRVCLETKLVFSSLDVIGTLCAFLLEKFESDLSNTVLISSSAIGCLSFVSGLVDAYKTNSIIESVQNELRKDSERSHAVQMMLLGVAKFEKEVEELFPFGVNSEIVEFIQRGEDIQTKNIKDFIGILSNTKTETQISLAILLSNAQHDPNLLKDKDFLVKVQAFANSTTAEKWWTRMKYRGLLPVSEKNRFLVELRSILQRNSFPVYSFPILSTTIGNRFSTIASLLLNSLVAADAIAELQQKGGHCSEVEMLNRMKKSLESEYKEMITVYEHLSPYSD